MNGKWQVEKGQPWLDFSDQPLLERAGALAHLRRPQTWCSIINGNLVC